jgi:hypothetical protein
MLRLPRKSARLTTSPRVELNVAVGAVADRPTGRHPMRRTAVGRDGDDPGRSDTDDEKYQARTSGNHVCHLIPLRYDSVYANISATI